MSTARLRYEDERLQRMEQAAQWLQRLHTAADDEQVVEDWLDWCQRDPHNQQAFDELAGIWDATGQLEKQPRAAAPVAAPVKTSRRALVASLAGVGLAAIVGAWWWSQPRGADVVASEFSSPIGVNATHTLADGSVLELGGGTRVTVSIGSKERHVELRAGELFVTVHHDTARPFRVGAAGLTVVATGTAFNVLRTTDRTTVTVAEGSVDTLYEGQDAAAPNMHLQTGQQLVHSHRSNSFIVQQADAGTATAWRSGMLHFRNEPLSEVIATVNRYATRPIVIEDVAVNALAFTGTARTDRIDGWLQALPQAFAVSITARADGSQLIAPRPAARSD